MNDQTNDLHWANMADNESESICPACGSPIDYCQGHGPIGDPQGCLILEMHDTGDHRDCHPDAKEAGECE